MVLSRRKGYMVERKIRKIFENNGWRVVRSGGSLGEADLICIKNGKCILLQIKSSRKEIFYYYGYMKKKFEGFPFYLVIDFGYNKIRILSPKKKISKEDGIDLKTFLTNKN